MPVINGVGSGCTTEVKQDDFKNLIALHIGIVDRITEDRENLRKLGYTFIDMNAGPGIYDGLTGSPLHFLEKIEETTLPYRAIFIEREPENARSLSVNVGHRALRYPPTIINDSNEIALREFAKSNRQATYGMLYHDPNGVPNFDLLADVSRSSCFRLMDFVISLPANGIKRKRGEDQARNGRTDIMRFNDSIGIINKTTWIIRKPQGAYQWTFIIGSNWPKFPDWKKRGFYRLDEEIGQSILHHLTYTDKERDAMSGQQSFFDLPELQTSPIEIMRST